MNPLSRLQDDVTSALESDSRFSLLPVFSRAKGVTEQDIESALGTLNEKSGKSGACVIVMMPKIDVPHADPAGPRVEVEIAVRVIEMPLTNLDPDTGTLLPAEEIALNILHALHGRRFTQNISQLYSSTKAAEAVNLDEATVCYDVFFKCRFGLAAPARVQTPLILGDASAVQIACNTPAATIYYTLDGSFPWSGNPTAIRFGITLITEEGVVIVTEDGNELNVANPFTISPGTQVRAAAYADNYQGSDATSASF
jgi:hypothetical protein